MRPVKRTIQPGDLVDHTEIECLDERGPAYHWCPKHCRLLVKAARLAERWPTDVGHELTDEQRREGREFRAFAAKVADAVTVAINSGTPVGHANQEGRCRCPLGCLPESRFRFPFDDEYSWTKQPTASGNLRNFYFGFGGAGGGICGVSESSPYYQLGLAYRRRFPPAEWRAA